MPSDHDPRGDGPSSPRDFIDDNSRTVGFVNLPELDAESVLGAILDGFARLDDDAVLTAYSTRVSVGVITGLCEQHGVDLVHSVAHAAGTTFVFKRSGR